MKVSNSQSEQISRARAPRQQRQKMVLLSAGKVGGDQSSYVSLVRSPATVPEKSLIATDEELGGAPSEGVDVASSSFPSIKTEVYRTSRTLKSTTK